MGTSIIWFGAGVFMAFMVGFYAAVVGATTKEANEYAFACIADPKLTHPGSWAPLSEGSDEILR